MTHPTSPLTSAHYPSSMEETVIANLEAQGYTIVMIETTIQFDNVLGIHQALGIKRKGTDNECNSSPKRWFTDLPFLCPRAQGQRSRVL